MPIRPARVSLPWLLKAALICSSRSDNSGTNTSTFPAYHDLCARLEPA